MPVQQSRGWCFTLNNYNDTERLAILHHLRSLDDPDNRDGAAGTGLRCGGFGLESGANTSTPHLQGWLYFAVKKSLRQLKGVPGLARSHFEPMRGSVQDSIDYCSKEGKFT